MIYASVDIETSGLNPETCQILSVGVVIEDTNNILPFKDVPKIHIVIPRKKVQGEPFALNLNRDLITVINDFNNGDEFKRDQLSKDNDVQFTPEEHVSDCLFRFFKENGIEGKITVAGKNYTSFDKRFLELLPNWDRLNIHRRVIDPATSFVDWENDKELPDLNVCKRRANLQGDVMHDALGDAWDVVQVLRSLY